MAAPETTGKYKERKPQEHATELVSEMAELLVGAYSSDQSSDPIKKSLGDESRGTHIAFDPANTSGDILTVNFREHTGDHLYELTFNPTVKEPLSKKHYEAGPISIGERDIPRIAQARQLLPLLIEREAA